MINFMQSNQEIIKFDTNNVKSNIHIIDHHVWEKLTDYFRKKEKIDFIFKFIYEISIQYNIDKNNIIKDYFNFLIRNYPDLITNDFLQFIENIMHVEENNNKIYIQYSLHKLISFF